VNARVEAELDEGLVRNEFRRTTGAVANHHDSTLERSRPAVRRLHSHQTLPSHCNPAQRAAKQDSFPVPPRCDGVISPWRSGTRISFGAYFSGTGTGRHSIRPAFCVRSAFCHSFAADARYFVFRIVGREADHNRGVMSEMRFERASVLVRDPARQTSRGPIICGPDPGMIEFNSLIQATPHAYCTWRIRPNWRSPGADVHLPALSIGFEGDATDATQGEPPRAGPVVSFDDCGCHDANSGPVSNFPDQTERIRDTISPKCSREPWEPPFPPNGGKSGEWREGLEARKTTVRG